MAPTESEEKLMVALALENLVIYNFNSEIRRKDEGCGICSNLKGAGGHHLPPSLTLHA